MNVGRLEIELLANMARLQTDMADVKRSVGGAMASVESSVSAAKTALVGLGVIGAAVTFAGTIKGAIDAADQLNKLSQRTGLAVESLSQLQFAAKLSDVSTESLTTGLKKLNISLAEGLAGDKEKIANFKALGITLTDATGKAKTADQVLLDMADSLSRAKDGAGKTAVSVALLGKAGDEMIPLLNGGSEAIKEMMGNADKLGLTISTDFAQRAEQFNDSLTVMQSAGQKVSILLAGDFVQATAAAMKAMVAATIEGGKFAGVLAGLQTLLTGDDRHKANVALVDSTEKLMAAQDAQDKARARGDAATVARLGVRIAMLREEAGMHQRMGQQLDVQAAKEEAAKPKQTRTINAPSKLATGMSDAERDRLKQLADDMAYYRKRSLEAGDAVIKHNEEFQKQQAILAELAAKQYLDYVMAIDKGVMASVEALGAGMREAEQYGLLKSQITALTVAKLDAARVSAITPEELAAIDAQIANYEKLIEIQRGTEAAEASRKASDDAAREWQKATDQIGQSLTDALMDGGKNGADYITGLFRTMVLRPVIQAAVSPVAGAVNSALGLGGMGGSTGLGGAMGAFGSSAGSTALGLYGGVGELGSLGFGEALSGGFGALGSGSIGAGLGTLAGALGPIAIGAMLASSMFDGGGGPKTEGGADLAGNLSTSYAALAGKLGLKGNARFGAFSSADPSGDALTQLQVSAFQNDRAVYSREDRLGGFENVGRSPEELAAAAAEEVSRAMLAAVLADDTLAPGLRAVVGSTDAYASSLADVNTALTRVTTAADLQEQIYQLTASDADKLARARDLERAAMDATLLPLLDQRIAQEDLTTATRAAADAAAEAARTQERIDSERLSLQKQLWQLEGDTASLRAAELAALDPANRALQEHIWAVQKVADLTAEATAAQDRYNASIASNRDFLDGVSLNIRQYLDNLNGTSAGLLTGGQQLSSAQNAFDRQYALAQSGNRDALGSITQYFDALLNASKAQYASGGTTQGILAMGRDKLAALPGLVSPEQLIVDAINTSGTATQQALQALTNSVVNQLQTGFAQLDTTADGLLSQQEFLAGLQGQGSNATLQAIFATLDANGDGQLSKLEAIASTGSDQLSEAVKATASLEAIAFQQQQLDNIWQRTGGVVDNTTDINRSIVGMWGNLHSDLGTISTQLAAGLTVRSEYRSGGLSTFAKGGVFTNSIVSTPTYFASNLMGEAGPEAIMPLGRGAGGSLGVRTDGATARAIADLGKGLQRLESVMAAHLQYVQRLGPAQLDATRKTATNTGAIADAARNNPLKSTRLEVSGA